MFVRVYIPLLREEILLTQFDSEATHEWEPPRCNPCSLRSKICFVTEMYNENNKIVKKTLERMRCTKGSADMSILIM